MLAIDELETFSGDPACELSIWNILIQQKSKIHRLRFVHLEHTVTAKDARGHCLRVMVSRHFLVTDKGGHCLRFVNLEHTVLLQTKCKGTLLAICQVGAYFYNEKRKGTLLVIYGFETCSCHRQGGRCLRFVKWEHTSTTRNVRGHCLRVMIQRYVLEKNKGETAFDLWNGNILLQQKRKGTVLAIYDFETFS